MASQDDDNSPPRSDLVMKTRRQSTLLDSPSRVTRSQVRRLSSAPAEPPMSPKPSGSTTRRRSVRVSESMSDIASQDDVSSIQGDSDTGKPGQRARRSTRRSFADTDAAPPSTRSTLTSIEEDSKPVTRRTRASLKPVGDTDSEISLPPTRRTRRSSISSVTSITSSVASPKRATRSRKNLSPVPSPTFSEASVLSEIPEVSPNVKKRDSLTGKNTVLNTSNKSVTPSSSNVSPTVQSSGKSSGPRPVLRSSPSKGSSPMLSKGETSFTTPRQLQLDDSPDVTSTKRSSLDKVPTITDPSPDSEVAVQPSRRSQGRFSLSLKKPSPLKTSPFIETPLHSSVKSKSESEANADIESSTEKVDSSATNSSPSKVEVEKSRRNSSRFSLSNFVETSFKESPQKKQSESECDLVDITDEPSAKIIEASNENWDTIKVNQEGSRRSSTGRLSLSKFVESSLQNSPTKSLTETVVDLSSDETLSKEEESSGGNLSGVMNETGKPSRNSTGRYSLSKFVETPVGDTSKKEDPNVSCPVITSDESSTLQALDSCVEEVHAMSYSRNSMGRRSQSSVVQSPELEASRRSSSGRLSLSSIKSPSELETSRRSSSGTQSLSSVKSPSEMETSHKSSSGRQSLGSVKSPSELETSRRSSTGRLSLCSSKSSPALENSLRKSTGRLSLSSNRSSPLKLDGTFDSKEDTSKPRDSIGTRASLTNASPKENYVAIDIDTPGKVNEPVGALRKSSDRLSLTTVEDSGLNESTTQKEVDIESSEPEEQPSDAVISEGFQPMLSSAEILDSSSRRASTGNLPFKKLCGSDVKGKSRSSTGSISNDSPVKSSWVTCELKDGTTSTSPLRKGHDGAGHSVSVNLGPKLTLDQLKISPIKQGELKDLTLTPSSSDDSYSQILRSPSNPHEKSTHFNDESFDSQTVSNEAKRETSFTSQKSDKLKSPDQDHRFSTGGTQRATTPITSPPKKFFKVSSESSTQQDNNMESSNLSNVQVKASRRSDKIYRDAAYVLSGGNISDFEDDLDESDDNQWQPVFTESTKTKKERRLEKKAQKKAEKEARKKAEREAKLAEIEGQKPEGKTKKERQNSLNKSNLAANEFNELNLSNHQITDHERIDTPSEIPSVKAGNATQEDSGEVEDVKITEKSNKKRKSLSDISGVLLEAGENDEQVKSKKRKSLLASVETSPGACLNVSAQILTNSNASLSQSKDSDVNVTSKKDKKSSMGGAESCDINAASELPKVDDSLKKKKKKKKLREVDESQNAPSAGLKKKKKVNSLVAVKDTDDSLKAIKKKKKKKENSKEKEILEGDFDDVAKEIKKKKKIESTGENGKSDSVSVEVAAEFADAAKLVKKKNKAVHVNGECDSVSVEPPKVKKLKKKKKKLGPSQESNENSGVIEGVSIEVQEEVKKLKKLKKKKKMMLKQSLPLKNSNGSDSDDAPASVSFAAGKEAALAELQAAAENVKKQKSLKKERLKQKLEKIKEEKLAKMERLKQKRKHQHFEVVDTNAGKGLPVTGSSSKIYFDEENKLKKSKLPKRLPDELLESLSDQPAMKLVRRSDGSKERVPANSLSTEEEDRLEKKRARKLARKLEKQKLLQSDYVPLEGVLGATRFGVVPLRNIMLAKKLEQNKLAEEAANFRQQSLFGNRIRRTPISAVLSHQEKLKASGKNRLVKPK